MKYTKNSVFTHQQQDKIGVLISNLGTPEAPTKQALKPYLKQFLSDPRVVEVPKLIWWCVLNLIILNVRPKKSAEAYATVWTEDGSPLLTHTKNQASALQAKFDADAPGQYLVGYAMRYGQPSVENAMNQLLEQGARKVIVLPLYPQYCASTTGSTFDALAHDFTSRRWLPDLRFISHYHDNQEYIRCVANSIRAHWDKHGRADKLVFSYHGIPKRYLLNGDPYHCECHKTTRLVAEMLELSQDDYMTTFQSRFGREEWLTPYTDETLKGLPAQGVKSLQVICPGFSSDCLETIEEIGEENREYFEENGGERYEYIPCLNSDAAHIDMLYGLLQDNLGGWVSEPDTNVRYSEAKKAECACLAELLKESTLMQVPKTLRDAQDIANTLDTAVKIPFLGFRVGLDFLIGLIPGVGDAVVLLLSWRIVYLGKKLGAPKHVITQMVRNSLVDFGLGCIPLIGDIVDIFYKANQKNVRLLEMWWITENKDAVDAYAQEQFALWEAGQAIQNREEKSPTQQALHAALNEDHQVKGNDV